MKRYKLHDIEWDTDGDPVPDGLPKSLVADGFDGSTLEELRDGAAAADWLSDRYGFCVKSLKVDETDEMMFTVFVERTETYSMPVNVLARDEHEAYRKVYEADCRDEFCDQWNELQPDVNTEYDVAMATDYADRPEGPVA